MAKIVKNIHVELSKPQRAFVECDASEAIFCGGVGAGKSFALGFALFIASRQRGAVLGLFAPFFSQLSLNTLPAIVRALTYVGCLPSRDYIINKRPPESWGISHTSANFHNIISFRTGAICIIGGLDNFNAQRGGQFDEVFIDEWRDVKIEARKVIISRMRGELYLRLGKKHRIMYATTPPDDVTELIKLQALSKTNDNIKFFFGGSIENQDNLPPNYISDARAKLDDKTFQREYEGKLISLTGTPFCYAFDVSKHVQKCEYDPRLPIHLSFDFNVNPFVVTAYQTDNACRQWINCIAEFVVKDAHVNMVTDLIRARFPQCKRFVVTGDANGRSRSTSSNTTSYEQIVSNLNVNRGDLVAPYSNLSHRESRVLVNSLLQNFHHLFIDPSCETLIADLERVQTDDKGNIDKSNPELTHALDGFRYMLHTHFDWFVLLAQHEAA